MELRVRGLFDRDIPELGRIHDKFFSGEYSFDELLTNALSSFVITDDKDKIIIGAQVRQIAEVVAVTDKDVEIGIRRQALLRLMNIAAYTCSANKYKQLHAFVQDEKWLRHLEKAGFKKSKGQALVLGV